MYSNFRFLDQFLFALSHTHTHTHTHTHKHTHTHTPTHTHTSRHTRMHAHMHAHTYAHMHKHRRTHTDSDEYSIVAFCNCKNGFQSYNQNPVKAIFSSFLNEFGHAVHEFNVFLTSTSPNFALKITKWPLFSK